MKLFENLTTRELSKLSDEDMRQYAREGVYSFEEIREEVEVARATLAEEEE